MNGPLLLVTGATGTIGAEVVRQLAARGYRVRALVRSPGKIRFEGQVEIVAVDLTRPQTLERAFAGVERALIVVNGLELAKLEENAFAAAKRAGVRHVVKVSGRHLDADFLAGSVLAGWHNESESRLRGLGVRWTILRPATFASNMLLWLDRERGTLSLPVGEGRDTFVDPRDVAQVAAAILASGAHDGATYELTGPELVTYREAARKIAVATGKPITFADVAEEIARAGMIAAGIPSSQVDALLMLFDGIRAGKVYPPTTAIAELLGRPARTFDDWLHDHVSAFNI